MEATDARSAVLTAIIATGRATRAGLVGSAGLSPEAASDAADILLTEGLIAQSADLLTAGTGLGLVCGIDLGASNCRFLVADLLGTPVKISHDLTPISIGAEALADWLAGRVAAVTAAGAGAPVRAVVVGLPGMVAAGGTTIGGGP